MTKTSPALRQRAESLAALDPVEQARIAARHDDLRYLAVCWKTCTPIGIAADTLCLLDGCTTARRADVNPIVGMEVPVMNADVARLDSVGSTYGTRYNKVIREYRKRRPISRPVI